MPSWIIPVAIFLFAAVYLAMFLRGMPCNAKGHNPVTGGNFVCTAHTRGHAVHQAKGTDGKIVCYWRDDEDVTFTDNRLNRRDM